MCFRKDDLRSIFFQQIEVLKPELSISISIQTLTSQYVESSRRIIFAGSGVTAELMRMLRKKP